MNDDALAARSPELMNANDTGLLVVDAQEKLLAVVPGSERIVWNIRRLLDAAELIGLPRAATEQYPEKLGPTPPELRQRLDEPASKLAFSGAACGQSLAQWKADGRYRVLVCGIETHVCIAQTALDLIGGRLARLCAGRRRRHSPCHRSSNGPAPHGGGRCRSHDDRSGDVRVVPSRGHRGVQKNQCPGKGNRSMTIPLPVNPPLASCWAPARATSIRACLRRWPSPRSGISIHITCD